VDNQEILNINSPKNMRRLALRFVLIVPFVLQIAVAVSLTGYFSLRNSQKSINNLTSQLRREITNRVEQHLNGYLSTPHQVNQINLRAYNLGLLNLNNFEQTGHYFWQQMRSFNIGYNNFANTAGEFIGVERTDNDELLINEVSKKYTQGKLYVYTTNLQGDRTQRIAVKKYDPRTEAWYADAVKAKRPIWSQIYQWEDKPEILSISASYPLYDKNNTLIGVMGIDLLLSQISNFLTSINAGNVGTIFIIERNGLLVASSNAEQPFTLIDQQAKRLSALKSRNLLINKVTKSLVAKFGELNNIHDPKEWELTLSDGSRQFALVTPWQDQFGLDWLIVVVIPESNFIGQIQANTRTTILLCGLASMVAIWLGLKTSQWISWPIFRLNLASQKIASGDFELITNPTIIGEVQELSSSFNQMSQELQQSRQRLEEYSRSLEQEVQHRTQRLQQEIQQRELAYQQIQQADYALRQSEARYRQIVETANEGIWIIDAANNTSFVNPKMAQMLGYSIPEMTGMNVFAFIDEQAQEIHHLGQQQQGISQHHDVKLKRQDGSLVWTMMSTTPIFDEDSQYIGTLAMVTDISDRKQGEIELQQAMTAAEAANRAKSAFLANMSHELRTPLTAILGFCDLLSLPQQDPEETQEYIDFIRTSGEHLLDLINGILDMSKIEAGHMTLRAQECDLHQLCKDLEVMFSLNANQKQIEFVVELSDYLPRYIYIDQLKLRQILINLISNAIKFTEVGIVALRIFAHLSPPDADKFTQFPDFYLSTVNAYLQFEVEDTGVGISEEMQQQIFEAFIQTRSGKTPLEGAGLGLTISRHLVELMGGEIQVTSQLHQGSKFSFEVPAHIAESDSSNFYQYHQIVYQPELPQKPGIVHRGGGLNLPLESLALSLPIEWLLALKQSTLEGDVEVIWSLIEQIQSQHPSLAAQLTDLTNHFQYIQILDLTHELLLLSQNNHQQPEN
jgi:PAS domain S-box-containing protein